MNYLLDTCVISELVAKQPNSQVIAWIDSVEEVRLHLSVITLGEIRKGIEKLPDSERKTRLEIWLNEELPRRFADRIILIDTAVMLQWGQFAGSLEKAGKPVSAMDSLIAAIALYHHLILVTRNEADFENTGVKIFNPWK
ncbi:MAG TPA: type II toxin-antitoxin system VapC family toxin [Anaerolineae bacterium]|jgi:tRNA(fMet)-specific endonuclease VapC|nr:type II toxin-antitoxin system VapC family toxin [Anaerolineae bacterium]